MFFYVRYAVSYRDLEEILAERGVAVDHATLNRSVNFTTISSGLGLLIAISGPPLS